MKRQAVDPTVPNQSHDSQSIPQLPVNPMDPRAQWGGRRGCGSASQPLMERKWTCLRFSPPQSRRLRLSHPGALLTNKHSYRNEKPCQTSHMLSKTSDSHRFNWQSTDFREVMLTKWSTSTGEKNERKKVRTIYQYLPRHLAAHMHCAYMPSACMSSACMPSARTPMSSASIHSACICMYVCMPSASILSACIPSACTCVCLVLVYLMHVYLVHGMPSACIPSASIPSACCTHALHFENQLFPRNRSQTKETWRRKY